MLEPQVVFATDLTGDVMTGLALACRVARERSATLVMLHVLPLGMAHGEAMLLTATEFTERERALRRLVPPDPTVPFLRVQEVGDPFERIVAYTARGQVDVLVMETRPRRWLGRAFGGGLVQRLSQCCPCPVLTYRTQGPAPTDAPVARHRPPIALSPAVLTTLLNARVEALLSRLRAYEDLADCAVRQRSITGAVAALARRRPGVNAFAEWLGDVLELELAEYQQAWEAIGVEVVVGDEPVLQRGAQARHAPAYRAYVARVRAAGRGVSVPLDGTERQPDQCLILAGARLPGPRDQHAMLSFVFDARRDFLRILAQPGPAPSAETYAFDSAGVMLSNSRFPDQLRRIGILPSDVAVQTPRRLRVCDPGRNLLHQRGALAATLPLTRAAAAAVAGQDGCDFSGYRDYRGVEVVGAWRWLAEYGFGVTAEVDR